MLLQRFALVATLLAGGIRAQLESSSSSSSSSLSSSSSSSVYSQTSSSTSTSTSTATDGPQTHEVKVGLAGFKFDPDELEANVGDTVRFKFYPPDHSVIRAAFGYPCIPWEYVHADGNPFYSGVQLVNTVAHTTTFDITINDTEPIFYYCGAPDSCMVEGMIGVINPNKTETLKEQKDAREEFPLALIPGDEWPKEGNPMATVSGLAVTETANPTSTSSASNDGDDSGDDHHHLTAGQIAGIAIGGAALLVIVGVLIYFLGRRGGLEKGYRKSGYIGASKTQPNAGPMSEAAYGVGSPDMSKHVPSVQYGLGVNTPGSPPVSPGMNPNYAQYAGSPLIAQQQQYQHITPPPQQAPESIPVELPTSHDPGNSPLPHYNNHAENTYSWASREEAGYRPAEKA